MSGARSRVLVLVWACASTACPRRAPPPPPPRPAATLSEFCRQQITVARLPPAQDHLGNGRWGVELDVEGAVLAAHAARFRRKQIEPNGQAWSDVLEQCLTPAELNGIELDPEAGSLHAWVETDKDKDRWVTLLCRAIEDARWLDRCLSSVDRSRIDD